MQTKRTLPRCLPQHQRCARPPVPITPMHSPLHPPPLRTPPPNVPQRRCWQIQAQVACCGCRRRRSCRRRCARRRRVYKRSRRRGPPRGAAAHGNARHRSRDGDGGDAGARPWTRPHAAANSRGGNEKRHGRRRPGTRGQPHDEGGVQQKAQTDRGKGGGGGGGEGGVRGWNGNVRRDRVRDTTGSGGCGKWLARRGGAVLDTAARGERDAPQVRTHGALFVADGRGRQSLRRRPTAGSSGGCPPARPRHSPISGRGELNANGTAEQSGPL